MTDSPRRVRKTFPLSQDLEQAILSAIIRGQAHRSVVEEGELSKMGRLVYRALVSLEEGGAKPPFSLFSLQLAAVDVLGGPREDVRKYLAECHRIAAESDVTDILTKVRDKQTLVDLVNAAAAMLAKGNLDVGHLSEVLAARPATTGALLPIADRIRQEGIPDPPSGVRLGSLPVLSAATGGMYGVWAVAGEPGVGKSTLAWQMAIDLGRSLPVIYDDHENTYAVLVNHARSVFGDDARLLDALGRVYYCDNPRSLDAYLASVPPPAVVVVDSVQKLPGSLEHRRESLDRWVHRLELLKKRGYAVLLISEIPRSLYNGEPSIAAFKETGEIEYTADVALQLQPSVGDAVAVYITKNRHHPNKGFVTTLRRTRGGWWFREETQPSTPYTHSSG